MPHAEFLLVFWPWQQSEAYLVRKSKHDWVRLICLVAVWLFIAFRQTFWIRVEKTKASSQFVSSKTQIDSLKKYAMYSGLFLHQHSIKRHTYGQFKASCTSESPSFIAILVVELAAKLQRWGKLALLGHSSSFGGAWAQRFIVFLVGLSQDFTETWSLHCETLQCLQNGQKVHKRLDCLTYSVILYNNFGWTSTNETDIF